MLKATLAIVVGVGLLSLPAAAAWRYRQGDVTDVGGGSCFVQGNGFRLGGAWSRTMVVNSGTSCGGTFRAAGRTTFKRLFITARPQHGRVVLQEGGHYHYTSVAGYHGSDNFSLRVCGIGASGAESCGNLHFTVAIQ